MSIGQCYVAYGSLAFTQAVRKKYITPGAYCTLEKYACTRYYPKMAPLLLNRSYVMLPYGELVRRKDFLFDSLDPFRTDTLFVRPDSGGKQFHGQLVPRDGYEEAVKKMAFYEVPDHELVVIATPQRLRAEWRFVVADKRVLPAGQQQPTPGGSECPLEALALAGKAAQLYEPDKVWTVDVGLTEEGDYKVVEIGSFSAAGLYAPDLTEIVRVVSKIAALEWHETH